MDVILGLLIALIVMLILALMAFGFVLLKFSKNFPYPINEVPYQKWKYFKPNYMAAFYDEIYDFLSEIEYRNEIRLSEEAKQLLILPLIEYEKISRRKYNFLSEINFKKELDNWRESVSKLVENIAYQPAKIDRADNGSIRNERTSLSVLKAYADKFCNIPPFCGER